MAVEVVPFEAALGAEIRGVDIRKPLAAPDYDKVRKAWVDRLVLAHPRRAGERCELMAFTRQFGDLEYSAYGLGREEIRHQVGHRGTARDLGDLEHHRERQGDRRARRRRGVLAHR